MAPVKTFLAALLLMAGSASAQNGNGQGQNGNGQGQGSGGNSTIDCPFGFDSTNFTRGSGPSDFACTTPNATLCRFTGSGWIEPGCENQFNIVPSGTLNGTKAISVSVKSGETIYITEVTIKTGGGNDANCVDTRAINGLTGSYTLRLGLSNLFICSLQCPGLDDDTPRISGCPCTVPDPTPCETLISTTAPDLSCPRTGNYSTSGDPTNCTITEGYAAACVNQTCTDQGCSLEPKTSITPINCTISGLSGTECTLNQCATNGSCIAQPLSAIPCTTQIGNTTYSSDCASLQCVSGFCNPVADSSASNCTTSETYDAKCAAPRCTGLTCGLTLLNDTSGARAECRPAAGPCDVAERCFGKTCPPDLCGTTATPITTENPYCPAPVQANSTGRMRHLF